MLRTHLRGFGLKRASTRSDPYPEVRLSRLDFASASVYSPFRIAQIHGVEHGRDPRRS